MATTTFDSPIASPICPNTKPVIKKWILATKLKTKLEEEQVYLQSLKTILSNVKTQCGQNEDKTSDDLKKNLILKKGCFYFLSSFGTLRVTLESFVFFSTFFALIPGLPVLGFLGLGLLCALISISFYHAFEVNLFKESLNIKITQKNSVEYLNVLTEQIKIQKELNDLLNNPNISPKIEENNKKLISENNDTIIKKKLPEFKLNPMLKGAKYFLLMFGMTAVVGGEYFIMNTLLSTVSSLLNISLFVGNALPFIIIGISIAWALGANYLLTGTSINQMIYPEKALQEKLATEFTNFKSSYAPQNATCSPS